MAARNPADSGMIDSSPRPARNRTVVPTYNLKKLTGTARHTRISYLQARLGINKQDGGPTGTNTGPHNTAPYQSTAGRSTTSPLSSLMSSTSPSASPRTSARDTTYLNNAKTSTEHQGIDAASAGVTRGPSHTFDANSNEYSCFNKHPDPRGHYYSIRELYAHGVWVGYLAPHRHNQSYLGLPSYNDLKANYDDVVLPFPPSNPRHASVNREAVCRGCLNQESKPITLRELPFVKDKSLVIMPLDGDDEVGMFCIMLPQTLDRSMKALQIWRPYEVRNDGNGETFTNSFMLLTLRNTNRDIGTIEAVLHVLRPEKVRDAVQTPAPRRVVILKVGANRSGPPESEDEVPNSYPPVKQALKRSNVKYHSKNKRRRLHSSAETPRKISYVELSDEEDIPSDKSVPTPAQVIGVEQPTIPSSNISEAVPIAQMFSVRQYSLGRVPQAERIRIIWKVVDNGTEYVLVHTIAECESFEKLLTTLEDEVQAMPSVLDLLKGTPKWKMSYCDRSGAKKAHVVRRGTEIAFDYLQDSLVTPTPVAGDHATVDVELEVWA